MTAPLDTRVDDVAELLAVGEGVHAIATRLHTTPAALARLLYRHRRPELARPFSRIARGPHK